VGHVRWLVLGKLEGRHEGPVLTDCSRSAARSLGPEADIDFNLASQTETCCSQHPDILRGVDRRGVQYAHVHQKNVAGRPDISMILV
jgi:hypothetical protein